MNTTPVSDQEPQPVPDAQSPAGGSVTDVPRGHDMSTAWHMLVEQSPFVILVLDRAGRILMANVAAKRMLDTEAEGLLGKDMLGFLAPDSRQAGEDLLRSCAEQDGPSEICGVVLLQGNGTPVLVDVSAVRVPWHGDTAALVTARDISKRQQTEQTLRSQQEQLTALFDGIDQIVYVTDPVSNEILFVNQHVKRMLGRDPTGGICHREFQGLDRPCDFCTNDTIMRERGRSYVWEHHNPAVGRDYLVTDKCITWRDGRDVRFEIAIDVTEQKRTEAALRKSDERYRELVGSMRDAVYVVKDSGVFSQIGPAVRLMLGYAPEEMIGRPITDFIVADDHARSTAAFTDALTGHHRSNEYRVRCKDGTVRWLRTSSLPYMEGSRVTGIWGILTDITERRQIEDTLRDRAETFRTLVETAAEGILVVNEQGRLLYANRQALGMLDLSAEEVLGKSAVEYVVPEQREEAARRMRELFNNERPPERGVNMVVDTQGRRVHIEIVSARVRWFGQETLLLMFHDVTDRLRLEEERQHYREDLEQKLAERTAQIQRIEHRQGEYEKLAAVSGLVARVAHEINNPLGGMKNAILLVRDGISRGDPQTKYLDMIEREIERMARIIHELYKVYRPSQESLAGFRVADTAREVTALLEAQCLSRGIRIELDARQAEGSYVGSEDAIRQILFNIVKNAIEASPAGSVVSVEARADDSGLDLSVADRGPGIADDVRARIYEPFFSTKSPEGSLGMALGLGLPISKSLVEALGGSLDMETTPGAGTVFRVWLPSADVPTAGGSDTSLGPK